MTWAKSDYVRLALCAVVAAAAAHVVRVATEHLWFGRYGPAVAVGLTVMLAVALKRLVGLRSRGWLTLGAGLGSGWLVGVEWLEAELGVHPGASLRSFAEHGVPTLALAFAATVGTSVTAAIWLGRDMLLSRSGGQRP